MKIISVSLVILLLAAPSSASFVRLHDVVVSDTSTLVNGPHRVGNAVATWVHPNWNSYLPGSTWIWETTFAQDYSTNQIVKFHKDFYVAGVPVAGFLFIGSDNSFSATVNGIQVACDTAGANTWVMSGQQVCEVTMSLQNGLNSLDFTVTNIGSGSSSTSNPGGLIYKLVVDSNILV